MSPSPIPHAPSPPLLQIDNLVKRYGAFEAVRGISLSVAAGEIVGLLGPNGAGKTTTIRCIASIIEPTAGNILIGGHDLVAQPELAKQNLAYVPELPHPYEMLTVLEHLRFIAAAYGKDEEMAHAEAILTRLDLWEKRHELAKALSKGMRQKLACACAFIHQPSVFCFDEPLIGIDPKGARELKDMLLERRDAGAAVLISTHVLESAERFCDRLIIMDRGRIVAQGTLAELRRTRAVDGRETLEDLFLDLTGDAAEPAGVA